MNVSKVAACSGTMGVQVVFSEAYWIGTKAENPEEHKLPMPLSLIEAGKKAQGAVLPHTRLECMVKTWIQHLKDCNCECKRDHCKGHAPLS